MMSSVVTFNSRGPATIVERPNAPSRSASSSRDWISFSSSGVGLASESPSTQPSKLPRPTYEATLTAVSLFSTVSRYPPNVDQCSVFSPWRNVFSESFPFDGPPDVSSPRTSVVTPCVILLSAAPSVKSGRSECECMSMKPGATINPSRRSWPSLRRTEFCRPRRFGRHESRRRRRTRDCRCRRRSGRS